MMLVLRGGSLLRFLTEKIQIGIGLYEVMGKKALFPVDLCILQMLFRVTGQICFCVFIISFLQ